jgi:tRNA(Ile)-lysidine synthase TilS/MesJ
MKKANISKKLLRVFGRTNAQYELIQEGDKVLLGLSGGKDSLALAHILKYVSQHAPFKFEFETVTVSYNMPGETYDFITKHCEEYGIKHTVYESNTFQLAKDKMRQNSSFCSFFSRMRRGCLYTYALENGFNKVALAHHLDDAVESFFMNFTYNGALRSLPPMYTAQNGLKVIRPLIFARERQLRDFAKSNDFFVIGDEACPAFRMDAKPPIARAKTKELLANLEKENPEIFVSLKTALSNIHESSFFNKDRLV